MPFLLQPRRLQPRKMILPLALLIAFTVYTCHREMHRPRLWSWSGSTMGTTYTVKIVATDLNDKKFTALQDEVDTCLEAINQHMSTYIPDSDISRFNASTSTAHMVVSPDLADVVNQSLELSRLSHGAFDITFSPLFDLWGFGIKGEHRVPTLHEIDDVKRYCGYWNLTVGSPNVLRKNIPELQITLNAIAPGYASDRLAQIIIHHRYTNLYVDVGGEVIGFGRNLHGEKWRVGIERPDFGAAPGTNHEMIVHLSGRALATSGDYRNFFRDEAGHVYAHILDPRRGRPVESRLASVSVLATNCMLADGLATTLFVLGPEEGMEWIESVTNAEALFILRNEDGSFSEVASRGFGDVSAYQAPR